MIKLDPNSKDRERMDYLYSGIRGTPPPDICEFLMDNSMEFEFSSYIAFFRAVITFYIKKVHTNKKHVAELYARCVKSPFTLLSM